MSAITELNRSIETSQKGNAPLKKVGQDLKSEKEKLKSVNKELQELGSKRFSVLETLARHAEAAAAMGLGYSVDLLGTIPWLTAGRPIYWGDCDTHGFAILNRMRSHAPNVESVLMDQHTLFMHRSLWGMEPEQHTSDELPLLTSNEREVYRALKANLWAEKVRLEQERIEWCYALRHLHAS